MTRTCAAPHCNNTFEVIRRSNRSLSEKKYCTRTCAGQSTPGYLRNQERIENVKEYLGLGFTPEQVLSDFVTHDITVASFVQLLRRRGERELVRIFDPMDTHRASRSNRKRAHADAPA